jgi:hypothetical protein
MERTPDMTATNSAPRQPPIARPPLGRLVARRPVLAFLVMAYAIAWTLQFAAFHLPSALLRNPYARQSENSPSTHLGE